MGIGGVRVEVEISHRVADADLTDGPTRHKHTYNEHRKRVCLPQRRTESRGPKRQDVGFCVRCEHFLRAVQVRSTIPRRSRERDSTAGYSRFLASHGDLHSGSDGNYDQRGAVPKSLARTQNAPVVPTPTHVNRHLGSTYIRAHRSHGRDPLPTNPRNPPPTPCCQTSAHGDSTNLGVLIVQVVLFSGIILEVVKLVAVGVRVGVKLAPIHAVLALAGTPTGHFWVEELVGLQRIKKHGAPKQDGGVGRDELLL